MEWIIGKSAAVSWALVLILLIGFSLESHSSLEVDSEFYFDGAECNIGAARVRFPGDPPEGFEGFILEAPDVVYVRQVEERDRMTAIDVTYGGELVLKGTFSIFVPEGDKEKIWWNLSDKIDFVAIDLKSGEVHKRNRVAGGWNLARAGVSVTLAPPPFEPKFDPCGYPGNTIDFRRFGIEVFDDIATMPTPDTTLEIYLEYMGFQSEPVRVEVLKQTDD